MLNELDASAALAALEWQFEMGVDEAISETPVNRYDQPKSLPKMGASSNIKPVEMPKPLPVADGAADVARLMAARCNDLAELRNAMAVFDHCALKKGARSLVFADGNPVARVMVIGEAPGRDEDRAGKPFIGHAGQLLDKMFAAIGLSRHEELPESSLYITNVLPWRPPQNRDPSPEEIALLKPFLLRHITLVQPDFIITMGNPSTKTLRDTSQGITKMRGQWGEVLGIPSLPLFHPAYLLRAPEQKRLAWADLLSLKARLEGSGHG